jgi:hypothetical protein
MRKLTFFILLALAISACSGGSPETNNAENNGANKPVTLANENDAANTAPANANAEPAAKAPTRAECQAIQTGDDEVLKTQTYAMDFEPFKASCFVTTYNADTDPPMEAKMAVYRDGQKVFDLPGQFNGSTMGCTVDGVAFGDLNNDAKKDIVVIGKCISNTGPYNENMIYVNDGQKFTTDEGANSVLVDYDNAKDVIEFAKKNPKIFFK